MIKEYFTDGLIGIAIVLSLFRMDLVGINNLINYPEVQDIILGQTAAYLPANFHHIHSSLRTYGNPKHLDFDNTAFNAWFQNVNNLPLFRENRAYDIEAFLVSASQENVDGEQYPSDQTVSAFSESNTVPRNSLSSLPLESANSFTGEALISIVPHSSHITAVNEETTADESNADVNQKDGVDSWFSNGTFPGSNLTKEDLKLIDILYQQDVDLGVGKEVFDPQYREELERERELELIKNQEWEKTQLLAREKEEQKHREEKDKWLQKNFKRDGETGEWVHVWNGAGESSSRPLSLPDVDNSRNADECISLEAALEFLENLGGSEESINTQTGANEAQQEQQQQQPQLMHQDSFNENWNGLVDYLNMTNANFNEDLNINSSIIPPLSEGISLDSDLQTEYLIQNATLPSSFLDVSADLSTLTQTEELNSSMPFQSVDMNATMDFDLGDLNFFSNFSSLQNTSTEGMNLAEGDDFLQNIQDSDSEILMNKTLAENMDAIQLLGGNLNFTDMGSDAIQMLEDSLNFTADSRSSSPLTGFNDTFDGLEGATGGSDFGHNYGDTNDQFSKVSRLSESSSDSGFAYQGGFTSPSSSASVSSSYAGSPSGSHNGLNSSASSNDTEHDPHGTRAVVNHHVAHNHTYNTMPGQTPREVKKYAQKVPSRKGPQSRDQRRAEELKVPFSVDEIVDSSVEAFNEMLTAHKLNDAQLTLIRDIRRRGKNKVAAQNCRKRKVSVIFNLSDETTELQKMRDRLLAERAAMDREKSKLKEKCGHLYTHIFQTLRNEHGAPYDPNFYSLQQSSDGSVFLVPRNLSVVNNKNGTSAASAQNTATPKKRKFLDE
ncbi:hypothetical protein BsWGS_09457 [Bradybaena similaris]